MGNKHSTGFCALHFKGQFLPIQLFPQWSPLRYVRLFWRKYILSRKIICFMAFSRVLEKCSGKHLSLVLRGELLLQVRLILEELAIVQEEILWLERKVEELKLILCREREHNREREMLHLTRLPEETQLLFGPENRSVLNDQRSRSQNYDEFRKERMRKERRPSLGSVSEILSMSSRRFNGKPKTLPKKNVQKPPAYVRDKESK